MHEINGIASSLLVGRSIVSQTNMIGDGEANLHPAVTEFFKALPASLREPFLGRCAESALISDQLWMIDSHRGAIEPISLEEALPHFAGAVMVSKLIRDPGDPQHGSLTRPCIGCSALLEQLDVEVLGA